MTTAAKTKFPFLEEYFSTYFDQYGHLLNDYKAIYSNLKQTNLNSVLQTLIQDYSSLTTKSYSVYSDEDFVKIYNLFLIALVKEGADVKSLDISSIDINKFDSTTYEILSEAGTTRPDYVFNDNALPYDFESKDLKIYSRYKIDLSNINNFSKFPSYQIIEWALENGMSAQNIFKYIITNNSYDLQNMLEKGELIKSLDLLMSKGVSFQEIDTFLFAKCPKDLLKYFLDRGLEPQVLLIIAANQFTNETDLIECAISKGGDINKVLYWPRLSLASAEKLLNLGLKPQVLLTIAFNIFSNDTDLIELAVSRGGDINKIAYLPQLSIASAEKLLNLGLKPDNALAIILELYSQELKGDVENENLSKTISFLLPQIQEIDKLLFRFDIDYLKTIYSSFSMLEKNPISLDNYLKFALCSDINHDSKKINLQKELIDKFIKDGADFNWAVSQILSKQGQVSILNDVFLRNKDIVVENLTPDNLLLLSILNQKKDNIDELCLLMKHAIANGANVNQEYFGSKIINMLSGKPFLLLKENGAKCSESQYIQEILEGGLAEITPKMPYCLHQIWLTSPENPREIRKQDLDIAINTNKIFKAAPVKWDHIVWTNNKSLIPKTIMKLETEGIKVLSIYEHQNDLKLFSLIEGMITDQKWGMASDTLRYSLINHFGGVYADLNFIFKRDVTEEVHKYNFYFAASHHHPVIEKVLALVERNLIDSPKYLASIDKNHRKYTDIATANPTYLAYYSEANKYGNIDAVYPKIEILDPTTNIRYPVKSDDMQKNKEVCDQIFITLELNRYVYENEISGALSLDVGNDSLDGNTWVN